MDFATVFDFLQTFWVVWLMLLFVGICLWAYWPGRRKQLETYGRIPLDDDEER
jgi:cytochrome c oxidase cbb3-type subunit 4